MAEFPAWAGQVRSAYADIGITRLFEWQAECLADASLSEPHFSNLVYSAPTSAGKTLVAELLAAHNAIKTNRKVFFLFPYVSTAREKLHSLKVRERHAFNNPRTSFRSSGGNGRWSCRDSWAEARPRCMAGGLQCARWKKQAHSSIPSSKREPSMKSVRTIFFCQATLLFRCRCH